MLEILLGHRHSSAQPILRRRSRKTVGSPYGFALFCPGTITKNSKAARFTNGTNMKRTAKPDRPMSWSLDTIALSITIEAATNQSACDQGYRVRPGSSGVFVRTDTIPSMIPQPTIEATNQNRSSSLPILLVIMICRCAFCCSSRGRNSAESLFRGEGAATVSVPRGHLSTPHFVGKLFRGSVSPLPSLRLPDKVRLEYFVTCRIAFGFSLRSSLSTAWIMRARVEGLTRSPIRTFFTPAAVRKGGL
jgi:hypothetical protein